MTTDLDIYRAAKMLVDRHGEGVGAEALWRADALAAKGDTEGESTWLRTWDAVRELQKAKPVGRARH